MDTIEIMNQISYYGFLRHHNFHKTSAVCAFFYVADDSHVHNLLRFLLFVVIFRDICVHWCYVRCKRKPIMWRNPKNPKHRMSIFLALCQPYDKTSCFKRVCQFASSAYFLLLLHSFIYSLFKRIDCFYKYFVSTYGADWIKFEPKWKHCSCE